MRMTRQPAIPHRSKPRHAHGLKSTRPFSFLGLTVPGIHLSKTQTGSTKLRHGTHPKSIWKTTASWSSHTPDKQEAHPPKEILARRAANLGSELMNFPPKSHNPARSRRGLGIFSAETPPSVSPQHLFRPLFPRSPLFPATGPATGSFNGFHPKSKSLAV